jgi:hypothetical protein
VPLPRRAIKPNHPSTCQKMDVYKLGFRVEAPTPSLDVQFLGARLPGIGSTLEKMKSSRREAFELSTSYKNSFKTHQHLIFLFSPLTMSAGPCAQHFHPCHALTESSAKCTCTCTTNSRPQCINVSPRLERGPRHFSSVCVILRYYTGLGKMKFESYWVNGFSDTKLS